MTLVPLAVALLILLLLVARANDRVRSRALEEAWNRVLSPAGDETLEYLVLAVKEHRVGIDVLDRAARARDEARLRRAVSVVEGFAPGIEEGLSAVRNMSRVVSALVPLPPVGPLLWRAWRLRGLSGAALIVHWVLVAAIERVRLRAWLLGKALGFCLRSLRRSTRGRTEWKGVEVALHDLTVVSDEAELTYGRVVRALDAVGGFLPA
jgi:hypothetical protein